MGSFICASRGSFLWAEHLTAFQPNKKYQYSLVESHYNYAFLIPSELCSKTTLTPEEAYRIGYIEKVDLRDKFPWNTNMEDVLHMQPEESLEFFTNYFEQYKGKYDISL